MNLLEQLNGCCRRLWRDESGVVFAFTVIVFLTLFVIACSVYAVGENLRQRIVLQNAADAAAYSGAVVQADGLSRVAAINKAMAWTYVQMGRAVMDYDVDVWLQWTIQKWQERDDDVNTWVHEGNCPTYWVGQYGIEGQILINGHESYPIWVLEAMRVPGLQSYLQYQMYNYRTSIDSMTNEEDTIIANLKDHINTTISDVLQSNTGEPDPSDYVYTTVVSDAGSYFQILTQEDVFLRFFNPPSSAASAFNEGVNVWFNNQNRTDGIQRAYEQQPDSLLAEWWWFGVRYWSCYEDPCCIPQFYHGVMIPFPGGQEDDDVVTGQKAKDWGNQPDKYYETELVTPWILTGDFFEPAGAIVVSVARKMRNPLLFMVRNETLAGLFAFFEPVSSSPRPYAWAASAARAGYHKEGGIAGEYWTQDSEGWLENLPSASHADNLSQADWDGELIPLPWAAVTTESLWDSPTWQPLGSTGWGGSSLGVIAGGAASSRRLFTLMQL